jgi:hypothetical protein
MKCSNCSNEYSNNNSYCPKCGENNPQFTVQVEEVKTSTYQSNTSSSYQSQPTQTNYTNTQTNSTPQDETNYGLAILSFFIPLVGFILAASLWNSKPNTASACLQASLWSVGLVIFVNILF